MARMHTDKTRLEFLRVYPCNPWLTFSHGLSLTLRRVLHRALDLVADPRHAARQARWRALRPTSAGYVVGAVRQTRATRAMSEFNTQWPMKGLCPRRD